MNKGFAIALLGLITLSAGCHPRPDSGPAPSAPNVNADSAAPKSGADPKTGTNTGRPDAPKDLKPGTDGNTSPPGR
jgi:hypothetical protein